MTKKPESDGASREFKLSKAPIVEAIVAIEFADLSDEAFLRLPLVHERLANKYARKEPLVERQFQVEMPHGPIREATSTGLRLLSNDGHYAIQLRRNAYVFSRLAPYDSWRSFQGEAQSGWDAFRSIIGDLRLRDLGLRYINKISYPTNEPIERYLRLYPVVPDSPEGGPQVVTGAYMRVEVPLRDPGGRLVVQEVMLPPENEELSSIALDNDFRFSIVGLDDGQMWSLLDHARDIKNTYFRHFITDDLLESYR
jgi:uncharacterized protein (TIGR04255 family)